MANATTYLDANKTADKFTDISTLSGKLSQGTSNFSEDFVSWLSAFSGFEWFLIVMLTIIVFVLIWVKSKVKKNIKPKMYLN